jgi:CheY-like chemotaxis protein
MGSIYLATGDEGLDKDFAQQLAAAGWAALTFADGLEVYARSLERPPAALLCGATLASLGGAPLVELLRLHDQTRELPIWLVAAEHDPEHEPQDLAGAAFVRALPAVDGELAEEWVAGEWEGGAEPMGREAVAHLVAEVVGCLDRAGTPAKLV